MVTTKVLVAVLVSVTVWGEAPPPAEQDAAQPATAHPAAAKLIDAITEAEQVAHDGTEALAKYHAARGEDELSEAARQWHSLHEAAVAAREDYLAALRPGDASPADDAASADAPLTADGFTAIPAGARIVYVDERYTDLEVQARGTAEAPIVYMGRPGEPRPVIGSIRSFAPLYHVWFVGLEIDASRSENNAGIDLRAGKGTISDVLIEDCLIYGAKDNIVIEARNEYPAQRITVRRCISRDSHAGSTHSQGLYAAGVDGLTIEQNVFDHNGWAEPEDRTIFNHAVYLQSTNTGVVIRGNILARSSSHGMNLHCPTLVEDNIVWRNAIGVSLTGDCAYTLRRNLIAESGDISAEHPRGVGIDIDRSAQALIEHNLLLDRLSDRTQHAIKLSHEGDAAGLTIQHNLVRGWRGIQTPGAAVVDNRIDPAGYTWSLDEAARARGVDDFAALLEAQCERPRGEWDDAHMPAALIAEALAAAE